MSSSPCPSCASSDVRRTDNGLLRCNVCDALYKVDEAGEVTVVEAGRQVAPAGPAIPAWVGAAAALVALALVLGAMWALRPTAEEELQPALAVVAPEQKRGMALTIDNVREGRTQDDRPFWLMTLHNDGSRPLRSPAAIVRLYDSNGAVAGEVRASAWTDVLEPGGDVAVIGIGEQAARHDRSEVVPDKLSAAPRDAQTTALMVRTTGISNLPDATVIQGEVLNSRDEPMSLSSVVVVGRTMEGRPVAWAEGMPKELKLAPGAKTTFEVRVVDLRVDQPDAWTAYARAKADKPAVMPAGEPTDEPDPTVP